MVSIYHGIYLEFPIHIHFSPWSMPRLLWDLYACNEHKSPRIEDILGGYRSLCYWAILLLHTDFSDRENRFIPSHKSIYSPASIFSSAALDSSIMYKLMWCHFYLSIPKLSMHVTDTSDVTSVSIFNIWWMESVFYALPCFYDLKMLWLSTIWYSSNYHLSYMFQS